jgi:hypothetical protein
LLDQIWRLLHTAYTYYILIVGVIDLKVNC